MQCKNHPTAVALDRCSGCAEPFCKNCLITIGAQKYCASCKSMAVHGQPMIAETATLPCPEANEALKYAIVGLFCCGPILEPVAIQKAMKAKKMIDANPRLSGSGKAQAALIIAIVGLVLWVIGMIARFASRS